MVDALTERYDNVRDLREWKNEGDNGSPLNIAVRLNYIGFSS